MYFALEALEGLPDAPPGSDTARSLLRRTRCTPNRVNTIAPAGASSHGAPVRAAGAAASFNMTPQLGRGSAKPRPTKDSVASAKIKAGNNRNPWIPMWPAAAGSR